MRINKCNTCNKEFTKPERPNRVYKYCSVKCNGANIERKKIHAEKIRVEKPKCLDCGQELKNIKAERCKPCNGKFMAGNNSPHWTGGKPKCLDCKKELCDYRNTRCSSCDYKYRSGENHQNWKGGSSVCVDCGTESKSHSSERCRECYIEYNVGENHHKWIDGVDTQSREYNKPYLAVRQARKKEVGGGFTRDEWINLKEKYNNMCLCCKKYEPEISLDADHIVPLAVWREWAKKNNPSYLGNDIENIQPLCRSCNSKKYTKIVDYRKYKLTTKALVSYVEEA